MIRSLIIALVVVLAACGGGGATAGPDAGLPDAAPVAPPVLRTPVTTPDEELAPRAAALLGVGGTVACDRCHAVSRERFRAWQTETQAALATCLAEPAPTTPAQAAAIVDCLRAEPGVATSGFLPHRLGIYAAAAHLPWFEHVFELALGPDAPAQLALFRGEAGMPRADDGGRLAQANLDVVAEWFARGLPLLDELVPDDLPPSECTTAISPEVALHVESMRTKGWRAVNAERGILMFGCAEATSAQGCLADVPRAGGDAASLGWERPMPGATLRVLRELGYASSLWTRSSADGRFVAHGGGRVPSATFRATILDLFLRSEIRVAAWGDPGFWPDNSGFAMHGREARFCEQGLLADHPATITFAEPQCAKNGLVGQYQHHGAAVGGDYWTVSGLSTADNGGSLTASGPTLADPSDKFGAEATAELTAMVHTGTQFVPRTQVLVPLPYEGDVVISPSSRLLISRARSTPEATSFILRRLVAVPAGDSYEVSVPEIARYCMRGAKPAISLDDRWLVFHHFVEAADWQELGFAGPDDPGFKSFRSRGGANVFLTDLATGQRRRITEMQPGQYAVFPHFRSDGWIYFMVRDRVRQREWLVASDAALLLE